MLDLGFEDEGFGIAFVNEIHPPFLRAYQFARNGRAEPTFGFDHSDTVSFLHGKPHRRLVALIDSIRRKGNLVGFIGGPPCPDFSVGGKNLGVNGKSGVLSQVYCDLVSNFRPDFFFFENVKGLWKTNRHRVFYDEFKRSLQFAGYLTADRLINAIQYGVPQNRERVFLLGVASGLVHDLNLRTTRDECGCSLASSLEVCWDKYISHEQRTAFDYPWPTVSAFRADSELPPPTNVPLELTVEHWFRNNDVLNHPNANDYFKPRRALSRFLSIQEGDSRGKSFKRLHRWRYSPTAAYGHNEVHLHPYKPRRLSVAESLAIQSVPSDFQLPPAMSLTDMFQAVGNGVPYLAARGIAKSMKELLTASADKINDFKESKT